MKPKNPLPPPAIEVRNLTRTFGAVRAIDDLSFEVKRGEIVGFLGPNGAGKSTTMRILCGLLEATDGEARVAGLSVSEQPQNVRRRIGYMPEMNPLPEDMRVEEYLRLRARLKEVPRWAVRKRVEVALETCDLQHKTRRKLIGTLSKGFRQRVGIADAILAEPEIVIMDEPTIGLDPHQVLSIRKLIDSMRGRMTLLLSSHILSEIELSCDSVIILNHGRMVAQGKPDALRRDYLPGLRLELETQTPRKALENALATCAPSLRVETETALENPWLRYTLFAENNQSATANLLETLVREHGLKIRALSPQRPCLEDVFLAATRQSWKEELPS